MCSWRIIKQMQYPSCPKQLYLADFVFSNMRNVSSGICGKRRPRSVCASPQSDQDFRCPLTESLYTKKCINGEQMAGWNFGMNLHLCILRMPEDTFLLGTSHIMYEPNSTKGSELSLQYRAILKSAAIKTTQKLGSFGDAEHIKIRCSRLSLIESEYT